MLKHIFHTRTQRLVGQLNGDLHFFEIFKYRFIKIYEKTCIGVITTFLKSAPKMKLKKTLYMSNFCYIEMDWVSSILFNMEKPEFIRFFSTTLLI